MEEKTIFCCKCGAKNNAAGLFCIKCGAKLIKEEYVATSTVAQIPPMTVGVQQANNSREAMSMGYVVPKTDANYITAPLPSAQKENLDLDLVFCVDCTATMADHVELLKKNIYSVCEMVKTYGESDSKRVGMVRAKLIIFSDYLCDGKDTVLITKLFELSTEKEIFEECVESITIRDAAKEKTNGLEAVAYAIRSEWSERQGIKRNIIMVMSNTGTFDLGHGKEGDYYPNGMVQNMEELTEWWESYMDEDKKLVMLAPDEPGWSTIAHNWDGVIHKTEGMKLDVNSQEGINLIKTLLD